MNTYNDNEKEIMLKAADEAIKFGIENHKPITINLDDYPEKLKEIGASFVTLEIDKQLRGCIGTLEAYQPLIKDIAQNAYAAAFRDPRFVPLTPDEYPKITKHISILSKSSPISFSSEEDLLRQIHPGIDGLILSDRGYRGTFLPSVWEQLPTPELFLQHLKMKAGLSPNHWSDALKVERYTVEVVE
jgi:AmmeMemoRadiSam system protein A